jgi:hypothetical protein
MSTRTIKRGDTWQEVITWRDSNGDPIDISGCSIRVHLRSREDDSLAVTAGTTGGEITITNATGGVAAQRVEYTTMRTVTPGKYNCDVELTYTDNTVQSTPTFVVIVEEDVTYT